MKLTYDLSVTSLRRSSSSKLLSLDFAAQTYQLEGASVALSSIVNFSRASAAMRSSGLGQLETVPVDTLRFDHDFETGEALGILLEASATNLANQSNNFGNGFWAGYAKKPSFVSGQLAPDGSANARTWNSQDTTGGAGGKRGGILKVDGTHSGTATVSVWLKSSAPLTMRFGHSDPTSNSIDVTTQWQRFTYTAALPNGQNRIFQLYEDVNDDIDVYIWGAQVELQSNATSLVETSGAPATRAADIIGLTGISGVHDVTVTYDDNSTETFTAQSISEGWWPTLSRERLKKLVIA